MSLAWMCLMAALTALLSGGPAWNSDRLGGRRVGRELWGVLLRLRGRR